jgi:hypothetical protein
MNHRSRGRGVLHGVRCKLRRTFYVRKEMGAIQGSRTENTKDH